ncbi:60S ribosomal protein L13a [Thrips palmi]|uniref:Large ribosomal subunit protein uL13 n=1 Tax=Thrips palmi TaxID=161013 RepID=A0A6P9A4H9_THRPL|nr:60S ribosomal protein L13a [Thrips palmi]
MSRRAQKELVIDGKGHLLGRLAAVVAKQLLLGRKVVVVRCEQMNMSGNFFRAKLKYLSFLRKRCNVNPARGPFHYRAPREIFWRTVRGMLPHYTSRGARASHRLFCYEGIPNPYDQRNRVVVPSALRILCLKPGQKYCAVGRLSHEVGWKYGHIVRALESKRKLKAVVNIRKKNIMRKFTAEAGKRIEPLAAKDTAVINSYGYH